MKKIFTLLMLAYASVCFSQSTTLVISQAYGGGGNSGATYNADFVELKNISSSAISLSGYSIQYSSAANTGAWSGIYALPAVSIPAGGYYLIQMTTAGTTGANLPAADAVANPTINMSGSNGRVALSNGTTALSACPTTGVIDKVGYGTSNCFEGTATAALTSSTSVIRKNNGCTDTDNNASDFDVLAPVTPRNSTSPVSNCSGGPTASLVAAPTTIANFGSINAGAFSASASFSVSGSNLTGFPGNITIAAPANFQVSNNNSTWGTSTTVAYTSATLAATTLYVRFAPQAAGALSGNVAISGGGASAISVAVSGTGVSLSPSLSTTALAAFAGTCANITSAPNTFTVNGSNLTTANVTVGPLAGYTFSITSGGTYAASLTLTQTGGTYSQVVYVKFTPTAVQSYNGNIPVSGGGATAGATVTASGAGVNLPPTLTTGTTGSITYSTAVPSATVADSGCTSLTVYGIEYSTTNGFANGSGTKAASSNLVGGNYTSSLSGLTTSTTYYYKAYATNGAGTAYGAQRSFVTLACIAATVETDTVNITTQVYDVTVRGAVADTGCSDVTAYGIEYSSYKNFVNGKGTKIFSTAGYSGFTVPIAGLLPNTTYYFKAFATNSGGTAYGVQYSFKTKALPAGLVIYSIPAIHGQLLHYSLGNAARGHYLVQLVNAVGQPVYKKDVYAQIGYIDDWFTIPASLPKGMYTLVITPDGEDRLTKKILVY